MSIGNKIKLRRKELGLSAEIIAEKVGVSPATIYRYESGEIRNLKSSILRPIASVLGVDLYDLVGWDDVEIDDLDIGRKGEILSNLNILPVKRAKVPLLGSIAAGEPLFADEVFEEYVEAEGDVRCDFALHVAGDSMVPTVHLGDLVFIRQQADVSDGDIAAVLIDEAATLKRIFHVPNGLTLISDNSAKYPPRTIVYPDHDTIRILGKAVAFKRLL